MILCITIHLCYISQVFSHMLFILYLVLSFLRPGPSLNLRWIPDPSDPCMTSSLFSSFLSSSLFWKEQHIHLYTVLLKYMWLKQHINFISGYTWVTTIRHFRHVPTHNFFPNIFLLMKNDKQRITYFNYVCFMFIVLMTSFHKLKDKHLQWVLWP